MIRVLKFKRQIRIGSAKITYPQIEIFFCESVWTHFDSI
jgi:hypothetical protein